jgi:hypothetical protein
MKPDRMSLLTMWILLKKEILPVARETFTGRNHS